VAVLFAFLFKYYPLGQGPAMNREPVTVQAFTRSYQLQTQRPEKGNPGGAQWI
jgi:hypothetical protein